ncbi:MAG TPA: MFS transporter [Pseudonocardiaceae bacterium]|nr:MFS transporter [Pseudonocardiaceae bacterium]
MAGFPGHSGPATDRTAPTGRGDAPFRLLIMAGFASLTGDGIRMAALPLFTALSTRSPLAVSAVATAEVLPWLLVALPAGALVDRWSPRRVVLAAHCLRSLVAAALAVTVFTGHAQLPVLIGAAFLLTCGETFADSAYQLLLVELSGRDRLDRANSWYVMAETLGLDLGGPLVAAALFVWQPGACFAVNALTFLISAACVGFLPEVKVARGVPGPRQPPQPMRAQLAEGSRFLLRHRALRTLVLAVVASALAVSAANALVSLYALQTLAVRAALVPTLWVAQALGTLFAAWLVPRLAARLGEGRTMVGALALLGVAFVAVGAIPVAPAVWVAYLLVGVGAGGWNVLSATRRQRLTPSALMGRVTSAYRMLAWGLMPLGAALAGPLARATSLATVFVVVGGIVAAVAVVAARPLARPAPEQVSR